MSDGLRCALVTPISPAEPGNGLAHRARFWQDVLSRLGSVTTILVPLAGAPRGAEDLVVTTWDPGDLDHLPVRTRAAPEELGRASSAALSEFDVVLALRSWVAPFVLGAVGAASTSVVVDLDDDDVTFWRSAGDDAEADRYAALLEDVTSRADCVTSVAGFRGSAAVPNSVTIEGATDAARRPSPPRLLMVGNFGYWPNVEGAQWFVRQVLPLIRASHPDVQLTICGPGSETLPFGRGLVADLDAEYAVAHVALVPLQHGSGSRIKAIEAFAHGVPVVGTTIGLDGLDVTDELHCLIADDAAAFARAVQRVLDDATVGDALAGQARALVVERYAHETVASDAATLVREVTSHPAERRFSRAARLRTTETEDGLVVLDTVTMTSHHLNPAAAAVFVLVGEGATADEVCDAAAEVLGTDALTSADVRSALDVLVAAGLVVVRKERTQRE